ncbi:hypothetical protein BJY52DRAFT_1222202 [Lactarius psammicola]|nr:hypothetical protein BJY52DRAFT_1222202 [Lactarius psammicola]
MPDLARDIQIQHTPRVHDDDFQAQRMSIVAANKRDGSLGREGMGKERKERQSDILLTRLPSTTVHTLRLAYEYTHPSRLASTISIYVSVCVRVRVSVFSYYLSHNIIYTSPWVELYFPLQRITGYDM